MQRFPFPVLAVFILLGASGLLASDGSSYTLTSSYMPPTSGTLLASGTQSGAGWHAVALDVDPLVNTTLSFWTNLTSVRGPYFIGFNTYHGDFENAGLAAVRIAMEWGGGSGTQIATTLPGLTGTLVDTREPHSTTARTTWAYEWRLTPNDGAYLRDTIKILWWTAGDFDSWDWGFRASGDVSVTNETDGSGAWLFLDDDFESTTNVQTMEPVSTPPYWGWIGAHHVLNGTRTIEVQDHFIGAYWEHSTFGRADVEPCESVTVGPEIVQADACGDVMGVDDGCTFLPEALSDLETCAETGPPECIGVEIDSKGLPDVSCLLHRDDAGCYTMASGPPFAACPPTGPAVCTVLGGAFGLLDFEDCTATLGGCWDLPLTYQGTSLDGCVNPLGHWEWNGEVRETRMGVMKADGEHQQCHCLVPRERDRAWSWNAGNYTFYLDRTTINHYGYVQPVPIPGTYVQPLFDSEILLGGVDPTLPD